MNVSAYARSKINHLAQRCAVIDFERARDGLGQFADTADTNPEKMRQAYVKPLRERLGLNRRSAAEQVQDS